MSKTDPGGFVRTNWRQIIIVFSTLAIIAIGAFHIGGNDFVYAFNNNISSFQALAIFILSILLWVKMGQKSQNRLLWAGLTVGWGLWTIAEWAWGISSFFTAEPPYPSVADFFWLIGYIPMFLALDARNRSIPEESSNRQKLIIWLCGIIAVGLTAIFILKPVIASYEPGTLFQTILTLFYPIGDLVLFVFVLQVAFKYQQGLNGNAWSWISAGYILLTVADLIFCYASANNIYYPDLKINFVSSLSDTLYSVSYMVIIFGLAIMRLASKESQEDTEPTIDFPAIPNTHILFFTDNNGLINDVSKNYSDIFERGGAIGQPFSSATGLPVDQTAKLVNEVRSKKVAEERPLLVNTRTGTKSAQVSGETISTPEGSFVGMILLLRLWLENQTSDAGVSDYHKSIIRSLMKKTGSQEESEVMRLLTNYHSFLLKGLIDAVETEGGNLMGASVSSKLQAVANESNWKVAIHPDGSLDIGSLPLEEAKKSLIEIIDKARQITAEITDETTVKKVEKDLWEKLSPAVQQSLIHYGVTQPAR
jgi:hypothetical protein